MYVQDSDVALSFLLLVSFTAYPSLSFPSHFDSSTVRACLIIVERSMRHRSPLVFKLSFLYLCYIIAFPGSVATLYTPLQASLRYGEHHDEGRYESEGRRGRDGFALVSRTTLWTSRIMMKRVTVTLHVSHVAVGTIGMLAHVRSAASRMMRPRRR